MTRCRCAECGAVLAVEGYSPRVVLCTLEWDIAVHPCGACLQEAAADAIACFKADREPMIDESRD